MEVRSQSIKGQLKDFPIDLVRLEKLIPHEMTIPDALERFKSAVQIDGMIKHPIIIDRSSMLVLDGHHRRQGLLDLGYVNAPVIQIDYYDDKVIELDTWYPLIRISPDVFKREAKDNGLTFIQLAERDVALKELQKRELAAIVGNNVELLGIKGERENVFELIRQKWINQITYYDHPERCLSVAEDNQVAVISWSYLKLEIVDLVKSKEIHLPKTTRHSMKYRYADCNFPLSKLTLAQL